MSGGDWSEAESKETHLFYRECQELHRCTNSLFIKLRAVLQRLHSYRNIVQNEEAVDHDELSCAVETMQSLVEKFKKLDHLKLSSDVRSNKSAASGVDTSSMGSFTATDGSPALVRRWKSPVSKYKMKRWSSILWQDRVTLAYLTYQTVFEILTACNNIAEQNHNHRTLENVLRLSSLYNEVLLLGSKDNKGVATFCRNTCPVLLHPLRKLSITRLLQILAQCRAEQCCRNMIDGLLDIYKPADTPTSFMDLEGNEGTTAENSDNSSLEIYKALTRHMTPPCTSSTLPPVEKVQASGREDGNAAKTHSFYASGLEHLLIEEETHVSILLGVAARSVPHLLGSNGVKPSRTSGIPRATKQVRTKVIEYYQQILWGEVGAFSEHILLWWEDGPLLGTYSPESCQVFCDRLHSLVTAGLLPELLMPAIHSLADGLGCHIVSTSWDQLFRKTLVRGQKFAYKNHTDKGSVCGQLFAQLLQQLVILNNAYEPAMPADQFPAKILEDLPLVEQIPVLHRLDHSVHTARLWATNTARHLINSWSVDAFFLAAQTDINLCLHELQMLKLTDHKDFSEVKSEHVMVCVKMRSKLASEVRDNIRKLKLLPDECIQGMATVCRTISLANLQMCFPEPRYWRQSSNTDPKPASPYVKEYLDRVLQPVLHAVLPLPLPVQQSVGAMVMKLLCEAWLDHIYMNRIKFSEWGALQLLVDFGSVPQWLEKCHWLHSNIRNHLAHCEVLRRCEGVGRLLLRSPGESVNMVAPPTKTKDNNGSKNSPRDSIHSGGVDTLPAEMFVPNQEQWLELRAQKHKGLCGVYSMCCNS